MKQLPWIISNTKKILATRDIKKLAAQRTHGYPMLHHIISCYYGIEEDQLPKDEAKQAKSKLYRCAHALLKGGADPHVLNESEATSIGLAISLNITGGRLCKLLYQYNACRRTSVSAKEWSKYVKGEIGSLTKFERLLISQPSIDVLREHSQRARLTSEVRRNIVGIFQFELEEEEHPNFELLNFLVDKKFVIRNPCSSKCPPLLNEEFKKGLWIRTLPSISNELEILKKRENLSDYALAQQRHTNSSGHIPHYTKYSCCSLVMQGIPARLFGYFRAGLIIKASQSTIPYWYDGRAEELTREFNFSQDRPLGRDAGEAGGEFSNVAVERIRQAFMSLHASKWRPMLQKKSVGSDRYGLLKHHTQRMNMLRWNEGMLRYKIKDIVGIYAVPTKRESVVNALRLRQLLYSDTKQRFPIYYYDGYHIDRLRSAALIKKYNVNPEEYR